MKVWEQLEIHQYAAETFYEVFEKVKYKIILGLTGTIDRLDGKQTLLTDKCPIIDQLTMEEAIKNKWLAPYTEYKVLVEVNDIDVYKKHNEDFMKYFAKFNFDFDLAMQCVSGVKVGNRIIKKAHQVQYDYAKKICTISPYSSTYNDAVRQIFGEIKASAFAWNRALRARKEFVMNHPKKIEIAELILSYRPEAKAITFNSSIAQAEKFKNGFVVHSGNTKKKNRISLEEFSNVDVGIVHSSKMLNEGKP